MSKSKQSHKKALNKIYVGIDSSQIGMLIDKSNIKCVKCGGIQGSNVQITTKAQ